MKNHINTLLQQVYDGNQQSSYSIPSSWGQGRATFGGVLGGMIVAAMRRETKDNRALYSLMLSFVGPVSSNEPFNIEVSILRSGRSAIHVEAKLIQKNQVMCAALACFGAARNSSVSVRSMKAPEVKRPEHLPALPSLPSIVPEFIERFQFRWAFGGFPFSGTDAHEMGGWMKFDHIDTHEKMSIEHLVTLIDSWPIALLPLLDKPAPASSVTWSIAFMNPLPELTLDWLLYRAQIEQSHNGYGQTSAHIWSPDGVLLAISHQTVSVFDSF